MLKLGGSATVSAAYTPFWYFDMNVLLVGEVSTYIVDNTVLGIGYCAIISGCVSEALLWLAIAIFDQL